MKTLLILGRRLLLMLCAAGARLEFILWADNHRRTQYLRRLHLRLMRVQHGPKIYCGPEILIRVHGNLTCGNRCALGYSTHIWNYAPVSIGDDFMSAPGLSITAGGHDTRTMRAFAAPVRIGDRVWCGINVTILPGVNIGDDVVIAPGSVVNKDVPSGSIVAGVPARVIGVTGRDMREFDRSDWG